MSSSNSEISELRAQLAELSEQVASLRGLVADLTMSAARPLPVADAREALEDGITEELLITISAAVAAYLGKRAPIRHIRLIESNSWGQQGRVNVQASHRLNVKRAK